MKKHYIQAGALTYAIFIMLVTIIIIGTLITIAFYHQKFIEKEIAQQKLVSYTNSILTAAIADSTLNFPWDGKGLELTENGNYSFKVTKERWGGYAIFIATSKYNKFSYSKKVLCGSTGVLEDNISLYMADKNNSISISGNTSLVGDCYLPKAEIKASYMEGDYYRGKQLVYGEIYDSQGSIPEIDNEYLSQIKEWLSGKISSIDSIINFSDLNTNEFYNSFFNKALVLVSSEPLFLNRCRFEGQIVIISTKPITIFPSAELIDVILVAPNITFKKGAECTVQAYAADTILLENNVKLSFPSTIGTISHKNVGLINVERGSNINGNVIVVKNKNEKENKNKCYFKEDTFIQGVSQIEGAISLQGLIYGSLYCEKLFLKTVSSYYENHLYNVEINAFARSPFYSSATLNTKRGFKTIKALH